MITVNTETATEKFYIVGYRVEESRYEQGTYARSEKEAIDNIARMYGLGEPTEASMYAICMDE